MITPFHEKPRSEVCPSFVRLQGNQVVSGKVKKSRNCPEFVLHIFDELCQRHEDKYWTKGGLSGQSLDDHKTRTKSGHK